MPRLLWQMALGLSAEQKERLLAARSYLLAQMMEIISERTAIINMLQARAPPRLPSHSRPKLPPAPARARAARCRPSVEAAWQHEQRCPVRDQPVQRSPSAFLRLQCKPTSQHAQRSGA